MNLKAFVYNVGRKPKLHEIKDDENSVKDFVNGDYTFINLYDRLVLVCNIEQKYQSPKSPKTDDINRVVLVHEFDNGKIVKLNPKQIRENFFVCEYHDGKFTDLPHDRILEVKALCGS